MCDYISTHLDVTVGVPQGSVLGPHGISLNRNKSKCMLFGNRCIETQVQVLIDDVYVC